MCITEYDEEKNLAEQREEAKEEGIEEGIAIGEKKGALKTLADLVHKGLLTLAQAAEEANMTVSEFEEQTGLKA